MEETEDSHKVNWPALPNHSFDETDPREMIDFPCSDDFLRHYHAKGMTPRCPEPNVQAQLNEMKERMGRLEELLSQKTISTVHVPTPPPSFHKTSRY